MQAVGRRPGSPEPSPPESLTARAGAALRPWTGAGALLLLCAVFGAARPAFFSAENLFNILNAVAVVGLLALGQSLPLIAGGFDLSQGAVASLAGAVTAAALSRHALPIPAAAAAGLLLGAALGWGNGLLVARARLNPFVATLGSQTAIFGLTHVFTNDQPVSLGTAGPTFRLLSFGQVGPFSLAALGLLVLAAALAVLLRWSALGRRLYALGGSEEAVRLSGLSTGRLKEVAYAGSGLLAAAGGIVMIARAGQASPVAGQGYELESLAACIVGGVALGGGAGGAGNVLLGVLTLGVVDNGLQMVGDVVSPNWRLVIRGVILLLAVAFKARGRGT